MAVNAAGTYVNNLVSNYGTATEFKNESANIAVPAARFLPKLKAIIASQKSEFEAALSGGAPTQRRARLIKPSPSYFETPQTEHNVHPKPPSRASLHS